ncbi:hypothetical protein AVEN_32340-1 [Araneus ventricosus]|uniref:Uncharacterized protein n=1 Tax=Araneus ventricosus TaxID=182803 RepID=A0A4Y2FJ12_ARAVE|nr:hypothetical protein AVEN_32340-1 [Araneus ventricosus]
MGRGVVDSVRRSGTAFLPEISKTCEYVLKTARLLSPRFECSGTAYFVTYTSENGSKFLYKSTILVSRSLQDRTKLHIPSLMRFRVIAFTCTRNDRPADSRPFDGFRS